MSNKKYYNHQLVLFQFKLHDSQSPTVIICEFLPLGGGIRISLPAQHHVR